PFPVWPAISSAAAVIHIDDCKTARCPVLNGKPECRACSAGRSAMAENNERRPFARWSGEVLVLRLIEQSERRQPIRRWELDRFGFRKMFGIDSDIETAFQCPRSCAGGFQSHDFRRFR